MATNPLAPRPTGRVGEVNPHDFTGRVFAWEGNAPAFVDIPGSPHRHLPLFLNAKALRTFWEEELEGLEGKTIKQIDDGPDFFASICEHEEIVVILDPHRNPKNGRILYVEVRRPEADA